jgi:hypothetical protein
LALHERPGIAPPREYLRIRAPGSHLGKPDPWRDERYNEKTVHPKIGKGMIGMRTSKEVLNELFRYRFSQKLLYSVSRLLFAGAINRWEGFRVAIVS